MVFAIGIYFILISSIMSFVPKYKNIWKLSRGYFKRRCMDFGKNFQLPQQSSQPSLLERMNRHSLDKELEFDEISHNYFYRGEKLKYSVTQLVKQYFEEFDASEDAKKMINSQNWPRSGYIHEDGKPYSVEEIVAKWEDIGLQARNRGTYIICIYIDNIIILIRIILKFYFYFAKVILFNFVEIFSIYP
jgi:hypothetical protein